MSDVLQNLPPAVLLGLAVLLVVWLVLLLLVPFMIESIRNSTRKSRLELQETNKKLDRLIALLEERNVTLRAEELGMLEPFDSRSEPRPPRDGRPDRTRREPTISG